jgi:TetR/AcrR family transcriptional regulator, repressor of fatR-cypB operon
MQRSQDKPDAILEAALELFVERGFHGTTVPEVADRAKVGAGTIYRYFENKEALVNALYRKWKGVIAQMVVREFPVDKPAREQFRTIWSRMSEFALAHPRELAFLELHHHGTYLDEESRAMENQVLEFAAMMIQRAQAEQALKPLDPALLLALVMGAFVGVLRANAEGRLALTPEVLVTAEQCCWEAIRA